MPSVYNILIDNVFILPLGGLHDDVVKVIQEPDFDECDVLIVPNLDLLPANQDIEYARICLTSFQ